MKDLIDRQEAINVVSQYFKAIKLNGDICIDGLKMLPFAQPAVEAISIEWLRMWFTKKASLIGITLMSEIESDWEKENG